jgi:hypothetical protein
VTQLPCTLTPRVFVLQTHAHCRDKDKFNRIDVDDTVEDIPVEEDDTDPKPGRGLIQYASVVYSDRDRSVYCACRKRQICGYRARV